MDYTPLNRHEKYLNAIMNGDNDNLPKPENREEAYLYNIAMNSGGGGEDYSVKYTEQSLTSEQQAQARENIGAAASTDIPTDAVKYTAQTLTDAQKTQARTNIGAGTSSFSGDYRNLTNPPPLVKGTGTGGNTVGGTGGTAANTTRYTNSVAYGNITEAAANYAFAFGEYAFAGVYNHNTGKHAVAIGKNVRAEKDYEWAIGKFNQTNPDTAFAYGDGTGDSDRHNLMELKTDGTLFLNGNAVKTEGGDDNKLRLGQMVYINGSNNFDYGFYGLVSGSIVRIDFSTTVPSGVTAIKQFVDFFVYGAGSASNPLVVAPIPGRTAGKTTTGAWIHAENCYFMFTRCSKLTAINNLSYLDTSEVATMAGMFHGCSALTSLDLSTFDTSNVQDMTRMFYKCTALTTLDLSSFDMTNVTEYTDMFGDSSNPAGITTLKTPKINPHDDIPLNRTLYSQDGTAYTNLPVTTGTSIELRQSWT